MDGADQAPEREVQEGRRGRGGRAEDRQGEREVLPGHQAARGQSLGRHPEEVPVGSEVTGEVTNVTDFGAFVRLEDGIEGLVYSSELSAEAVDKPSAAVEVGQTVTALVTKVDPVDQKISLSIRAVRIASSAPR